MRFDIKNSQPLHFLVMLRREFWKKYTSGITLHKLDVDLGKYIDLVHRTEKDLVDAFKLVAKAHRDEVDIERTCLLLSSWSLQLADRMEPVANRYKKETDRGPDRLTKTLLKKACKGSMAMLRDLHDLYLIVNEVLVCCTILKQGGTALVDEELVTVCEEIERQTTRQSSWLMTRMKSAAPQTLIVAGP